MFKNNLLLEQLKSQIVKEKTVSGTVKATMKNFGFLHCSAEQIYFIPPEEMIKVLNGDKVTAIIQKDEKTNKEYVTISTLESTSVDVLIGKVKQIKNSFFLIPDFFKGDAFFYVSPSKLTMKDGDYIKAKLKKHPFKTGKKSVELLEVITHESDTMLPWKYMVSKHELGNNSKVVKNDETIEDNLKNRTSLVDEVFYSIDSESTRDIDDAISIKKVNNEYHLTVAIADPTVFIDENSESEKSLRDMGFTYYLPRFAQKMLPEVISENLSALVEHKERLAISCFMIFDETGNKISHKFEETVIKSKGKLSYNNVTEFILNGKEHPSLTNEIKESLLILKEFYDKQSLLNIEKYSPTFDDDFYFIFENDKVVGIEKRKESIADKMVAISMTLANISFASFLTTDVGFGVFNSNTGLKSSEKDLIVTLINHYDLSCDVDLILQHTEESVIEYNNLLKQISEKEDSYLLELFRSFSNRTEFVTSPSFHLPVGHVYATFTSPIRKYGDFVNHRILKKHLKGEVYSFDHDVVNDIANGNKKAKRSEREIKSWFYEDLYKDLSNETFTGKISAINKNGLQVTIQENGATGFIPFRLMFNKKELESINVLDFSVLHLGDKPLSYSLGGKLNVKLYKNESKSLTFIIV